MTDPKPQRLIHFCGGPLDGCVLDFDPETVPGLGEIVFRVPAEFDSRLGAMRPAKEWVYRRAAWAGLAESCDRMAAAAEEGQAVEAAPAVLVYRLSSGQCVVDSGQDADL